MTAPLRSGPAPSEAQHAAELVQTAVNDARRNGEQSVAVHLPTLEVLCRAALVPGESGEDTRDAVLEEAAKVCEDAKDPEREQLESNVLLAAMMWQDKFSDYATIYPQPRVTRALWQAVEKLNSHLLTKKES